MIGLKEVLRTYSGVLEAALGAPPTTKDIIKDGERPCCYLQPATVTRAMEGTMIRDRYALEIYYFSPRTHTGWLDLVEARDALTLALLAPARVADGFWLAADSVDAELYREEMALGLYLTVETLQEPEEDAGVLMDTLNYYDTTGEE